MYRIFDMVSKIFYILIRVAHANKNRGGIGRPGNLTLARRYATFIV